LQVEAKEIDDFVLYQTVGKVPGDAAKNKAKSDLAREGVGTKMMPGEKQGYQGEQGDQHQGVVVAAENVPGRTGVSPMNEFKETVDDDFFVIGRQYLQHQPFGELVEGEDDERNDGNAAIRTPKNGLGGRHSSVKSEVQSPKSSQSQVVS